MTINDEIIKKVFDEHGSSDNIYPKEDITKIIKMAIHYTEAMEQARIISLLDEEHVMMDTDIGGVIDKQKLILWIQMRDGG